MNFFNRLENQLRDVIADLQNAGELPADLTLSRIAMEPPRDAGHGDVACNAAMVLAKPAGRKPRELAEKLSGELQKIDTIESIEIAGPGFINIRLKAAFWPDRLQEILAAGSGYGRSQAGGGRRINVEYVSTNPTGPLHIGHVRGAIFGDALATLLETAGYDVTREYLINDAGNQVDILARSVYLRYGEALGRELQSMPDGLYPGDYLIPVGRLLAEELGDVWLDKPEADWLVLFRRRAVDAMMDLIKQDLANLGVSQDVFFSEQTLHDSGDIDAVVAALEARDLIYVGTLAPPKGKTPDDWEPRPQTLFKATEFGDDVDRPLKKSDGAWTYFAADIAYHYNKFTRGFSDMVDVWGADHGGYVKRMTAAVRASSNEAATLDVRLCQIVHILRDGQPVRMSKRSGDFVTVSDVLEEVSKDVVRFMMLTRRNDAQLEFDLVKVTEQSKDNPVFYVQYAHARIHSVLRNAAQQLDLTSVTQNHLSEAPLQRLTDAGEVALIKQLASWPRLIEAAAHAREPHRIAFYLYDLAAAFHAQWNRGNEQPELRFIYSDDRELTFARLALITGVQHIIASGLHIMGVQPVEEMR